MLRNDCGRSDRLPRLLSPFFQVSLPNFIQASSLLNCAPASRFETPEAPKPDCSATICAVSVSARRIPFFPIPIRFHYKSCGGTSRRKRESVSENLCSPQLSYIFSSVWRLRRVICRQLCPSVGIVAKSFSCDVAYVIIYLKLMVATLPVYKGKNDGDR